MSQDKCQVCKNELHSITTVSFGNGFICRDCSMLLVPLLNSIADGILDQISFYRDLSLKEILKSMIENDFHSVMKDQHIILEILK